MGDGRSLVVAVPIGADADTALLSDVARGGGGVVVPYQPGQRLEEAALDVLNATYGTALRDVEVVLPPGLHDVAPAVLPPLRAGSETIVTARLAGGDVKGDIILRGKVGGDPFEAKYPIDLHASNDEGNAFVPRLYAAARIADRERAGGDTKELVALSQRFRVPSRATSLLVLESEAMFKAFGIERGDHAIAWTGESAAKGAVVASDARKAPKDLDTADAFDGDAVEEKAKKESESMGAIGGGFAAATANEAAPAKRAAAPASPPPAATMAAPKAAVAPPWDALDDAPRMRRRPGGQFMKKVCVRKASVSTDAGGAVSADRLAQARAAVAAAPDERARHKDLAKLLALSGQLDELGATLEKWSTRDPLDADVISSRAELAARRGDRDGALRIMSGGLAASALAPADAFTMAQAIGRSFERVGRPEACAFWVAAAELKSTDPAAVAKAMTCERSGKPMGWLDGLKDTQRAAISTALAKTDAKPETATGDVVVSATWTGGADLDLTLVDPSGRRAGAVSRLKSARVENALATDRESVSLSSNEAGAFVVEIARADASKTASGSSPQAGPLSGTVTIRAFGQTQTIPFTLSGARTTVGRVDVRWEAELVPVDGPFAPDPVPTLAPFNRTAAANALGVSVAHCRGQNGTGHATVTFAPSGRVSDVVVDDPIFAGSSTAQCVESTLTSISVPPFGGAAVRVGKSFSIR